MPVRVPSPFFRLPAGGISWHYYAALAVVLGISEVIHLTERWELEDMQHVSFDVLLYNKYRDFVNECDEKPKTNIDSCLVSVAKEYPHLVENPLAEEDLAGARRRRNERYWMRKLGGNHERWLATATGRFHWQTVAVARLETANVEGLRLLNATDDRSTIPAAQPLNVSRPLDWVSPKIAIEIFEKAEELAEAGEDAVNDLGQAADVIIREAVRLALMMIGIAEQQQKRDEESRKANGAITAREAEETPADPVLPRNNGGVVQSAEPSQGPSSPQQPSASSDDEEDWAKENRELFPELDIHPAMEEFEIVWRLRRFLRKFRAVERQMYQNDIHCWLSANLVTRLLVARGFNAFVTDPRDDVHQVTAVRIGQRFYLIDINGQQFGEERDKLVIVPEEKADSEGLYLFWELSRGPHWNGVTVDGRGQKFFTDNDLYEDLEQRIRFGMDELNTDFPRALEAVFDNAPPLPPIGSHLENLTTVPERTAMFVEVILDRALEKLRRQNATATERDVVVLVMGPGTNLVEILAWLEQGASVVVIEEHDTTRYLLHYHREKNNGYLQGYGERLRILDERTVLPVVDITHVIHPGEIAQLQLMLNESMASLKSGGIYVIQHEDMGYYDPRLFDTGVLPVEIVLEKLFPYYGEAFMGSVHALTPLIDIRLIIAEKKQSPLSEI